jgi:hypothetical protein
MNPPPKTSSIHRTGPSAVTYHIPNSPPSPSNPHLKTIIHLPQASTWSSGLHFHTQHTEYLRLVHGTISVQLGTDFKTFSAAAGGEIDDNGTLISPGLVVTVAKKVRHDWGRADFFIARRRRAANGILGDEGWSEDWSDDVVVEEWTDPSDLAKPLFFWNLNGVMTASADAPLSTATTRVARTLLGGWWVPFQLFVIFWELDNWPVFLSLESLGIGTWLEQGGEFVVTFSILFIASAVGRLVGVEAVAEERTPKLLWVEWRADGVSKDD